MTPKRKPQHFIRSMLGHIHEYISAQGFFFTKQDIANLYLSLKTKPFVILAGISGTGKTQLVRQFAAAISCENTCTLIPVRPDWTDNADLLGYKDLQGNFQRRELLNVLIHAKANPELPHFVILDEMNLARVEYYFSDFLSVMETREKRDNHIKTDPILRSSQIGTINDSNQDLVDLCLPENIYIIGTVNMDETTHSFSRKVLDRANSIEMNEVNLDWSIAHEPIPPLESVTNDWLVAPYVHLRDVEESEKKRLNGSLLLLMKINEVLKKADLQFGYRIRDEIAFYLLNRHEIRELITEHEAIDYQILQKILPRIHGSSRRIGEVLLGLMDIFTPKEMDFSPGMYADEVVTLVGEPRKKGYPYPKSLDKLLFMYRRFEEDGFTSFWI